MARTPTRTRRMNRNVATISAPIPCGVPVGRVEAAGERGTDDDRRHHRRSPVRSSSAPTARSCRRATPRPPRRGARSESPSGPPTSSHVVGWTHLRRGVPVLPQARSDDHTTCITTGMKHSRGRPMPASHAGRFGRPWRHWCATSSAAGREGPARARIGCRHDEALCAAVTPGPGCDVRARKARCKRWPNNDKTPDTVVCDAGGE